MASRRRRRAAEAEARKEKISRAALEAYVHRTVKVRPLAAALPVLALLGGAATGKPMLALVATIFALLVSGVLIATTVKRCPVCRTPLVSPKGWPFLGTPHEVSCPRCHVVVTFRAPS